MSMQTVMVVGAGQMGAGIAQVHAVAGFHVYFNDLTEEKVTAGRQGIEKQLQRQVDKGRMEQDAMQDALGRITPSTSLEDAANVDLCIEAAVEQMEIKKKIFQELDRHAPTTAILATNTSSLPITEIAAETNRPAQVIGMHFMNPVPVMKLVEVIRGLQTNEDTYKDVKAAAEALGKTPVEVNDAPGFVSNRVLMPMINEAICTVNEGIAAPEDVDQVMTLGMNQPMGPLTLADFIGLDTCLYIMEVLHEGFGEDKYRPSPLLRKYVKAGWLGRKSGRGFYVYNN
ncbi:3-hydroxybutyryl-CoA dehydrogenase [Salsuginibacillus halophilus]|uniref:3-hydroxybutyryl-CoA dehydrogenase n=1 Tax=Salsuginibacillus halophilus TaxID=517424 RepID=A0A2P8HI04_9BACI|nr:3-hydroxybutyryl-CoA dehydrogenase [Salsuginibacillus halophilus]PSL45829.1 3-hydroxybutyryl-CoA dehydrogenase [Salsuginibacillus halophilus]